MNQPGELTTGRELILNAAESVLQIGVTVNEEPLCFEEWKLKQRGAEILAELLAELCRKLGFKSASFRRIACVSGPGSFTGIRLVLATAAAIRRVSGCQLAGIDYLRALATSAAIWRGLLYPGKIFILTHARRNQVHFCEFLSLGPVIPAAPLGNIELISPEEAIARIGDTPCLVAGSGIGRNPDVFSVPETGRGPSGAPNAVLMPELVNPVFQALCLLARHGDYFPRDLEPNYVRQCDAVEHLAANPEASEKLAQVLASTPDSIK